MERDDQEEVAVDAALVRGMARLAGVPLTDEATARRVAGGAAAAIAAVRLAAGSSLFDQEPAAFLPALERLADPDAGGGS
jgi:hypothetical protein